MNAQSPLPLYEKILHSLDLVVQPNGNIALRVAEMQVPLPFGSGRVMVMPTPEILRNPSWHTMQPFHPLCESFLRGQSPVIQKLRDLVNVRLSQVICAIMCEFMALAADTTQHASIPPSQVGILTLLEDVDAKTMDALTSVLSKISPLEKNKIVNVFLSSNAKLDGTKYRRVAAVSFPINDQFESKEHQIFGVHMRKKDKLAIKKLFDYVLPKNDVIQHYSYGTDSMVAPYFLSLMNAFNNVVAVLNMHVHNFRKIFVEANLHTDMTWITELSNLDRFTGIIPALPGNVGETDTGEDENLTQQLNMQSAATATPAEKKPFIPLGASSSTAPAQQPPAQPAPVQPAPQYPQYNQPAPPPVAQPVRDASQWLTSTQQPIYTPPPQQYYQPPQPVYGQPIAQPTPPGGALFTPDGRMIQNQQPVHGGYGYTNPAAHRHAGIGPQPAYQPQPSYQQQTAPQQYYQQPVAQPSYAQAPPAYGYGGTDV